MCGAGNINLTSNKTYHATPVGIFILAAKAITIHFIIVRLRAKSTKLFYGGFYEQGVYKLPIRRDK